VIREISVCVKGGGDLASGVAWRLHRCGFRVLITEISRPMAVRRRVAFSEAVYDGHAEVEGVGARLVQAPDEVSRVWDQGRIPLLVDPECRVAKTLAPRVMVDAILAKKNTGTRMEDAPLVIALGPGFEAGRDAHFVVETNRGHYLGRLITEGSAEPNTGVPGAVAGISVDRVLRAPCEGIWESGCEIGEMVSRGDTLGSVDGQPVKALISGVLRGMIRPCIPVTAGLKIGDIDPRGVREHCFTISEKALAIAGGVLEGILISSR